MCIHFLPNSVNTYTHSYTLSSLFIFHSATVFFFSFSHIYTTTTRCWFLSRRSFHASTGDALLLFSLTQPFNIRLYKILPLFVSLFQPTHKNQKQKESGGGWESIRSPFSRHFNVCMYFIGGFLFVMCAIYIWYYLIGIHTHTLRIWFPYIEYRAAREVSAEGK